MSKKTIAAILMGGVGARFGSDDLPKQFHRLSGKPIYLHTLDVFYESGLFDEIILVCTPKWISRVANETAHLSKVRVIEGGSTRQNSSYLAIKSAGPSTEIIVIHDAVRPFIRKDLLEKHIAAAKAYGAVNTCIPTTDTINCVSNMQVTKIPPREQMYRGQTPQSFQWDLINEVHLLTKFSNISDDCRLVLDQNIPVQVVQGSDENIKITIELDLIIAEHLLRTHQRELSTNKPLSFTNKIYAVVGGTSGIGLATCQILEKFGARVLNLSRSSKEFPVDISDPKAIQKNFKKIKEKYGLLDGLINSAAILNMGATDSLVDSQIESMVRINLLGTIYSCKYACIKDGGHIINLASSSFTKGRQGYGIYSCTKAAVVNFTQAFAAEKPNLFINAIVPNRTLTPMRTTNFPNEKTEELLKPEQVALEIATLLSEENITGQTIELKRNHTEKV